MVIFASSYIPFHIGRVGWKNNNNKTKKKQNKKQNKTQTLCTVVILLILVLFNRFILDWDSHHCRLRHTMFVRWICIPLIIAKLYPQQYCMSVDGPNTLPDLCRLMIRFSPSFRVILRAYFFISWRSNWFEVSLNNQDVSYRMIWTMWFGLPTLIPSRGVFPYSQ